MAVTKNQIDRLYMLDEIFQRWEGKWYTQDELLDLLNNALQTRGISQVSKRTLQEDIKYMMSETCQAPIEQSFFNRKRCYRYTDPHFSLRSQQLSPLEKQTISEALSLLGSFEGRPDLEWLDNLGPLLTHNQDVTQARKILSFQENPDLKNRNLVSDLYKHILANTPLHIVYHPFHGDRDIHFRVSPQYLKQYNNRWFLLTKDPRFDNLSILSIDRIVSIEQTTQIDYEIVDRDFDDYFYDIIGISYTPGTPCQCITMWVSHNTTPYIETKPLHPTQKPVRGDALAALQAAHPSMPNGSYITIKVIPNYELYTQLLSYGAELCVISPANIVDKMREHINNVQQRYNDQ